MAVLTEMVICSSTVLLKLARMSSSPLPMTETATLYLVSVSLPPVIRSIFLMFISSLWKKTVSWAWVWLAGVLWFHLRRTGCRNIPHL